MNSTLDVEMQKKIIQEEIDMYNRTIYLWTIRVKVAEKIQDKTMKDNAVTELEKCEKSLDVLREELKLLSVESKP
jgi:hypothetical protein